MSCEGFRCVFVKSAPAQGELFSGVGPLGPCPSEPPVTFKWFLSGFVFLFLLYFKNSQIYTDGSKRNIKPRVLFPSVLNLLSSFGCLQRGIRAAFEGSRCP